MKQYILYAAIALSALTTHSTIGAPQETQTTQKDTTLEQKKDNEEKLSKIEWSKKNIRLTIDNEEMIPYSFKGINTSDRPIFIKKIEKSCVCHSAESNKQEINPGEEVEITGSLEVKRIRNRNTAHIIVVTEENNEEITTLLEAEIVRRNVFSVSSPQLVWVNRNIEEKLININVPNQEKITKVEILGGGDYELNLEETPEGKNIKIKPSSTERKTSILAIHREKTDENGQTINIPPYFIKLEVK